MSSLKVGQGKLACVKNPCDKDKLRVMSITNGLEGMWDDLVRMCNDQFESDPFKRLLGIKFTKAAGAALLDSDGLLCAKSA